MCIQIQNIAKGKQ